MIKRPLLDRFNEKWEPVTESGCWIWTGYINEKGYGGISVNNKCISAHRIAYKLFVGDIPKMGGHHGACVLHTCDIPHCVNPDHLYIGSNQDNVHDMYRRKRYPVRISDESVRLLRSIGEFHSYTELANIFDIDRTYAKLLLQRKFRDMEY